MPKSIKTVGLFIRPELDEDSGTTITNLINWLNRRKINIFIDRNREQLLNDFLKKVSSKKVTPEDEKLIFKNSDLIFSLGETAPSFIRFVTYLEMAPQCLV